MWLCPDQRWDHRGEWTTLPRPTSTPPAHAQHPRGIISSGPQMRVKARRTLGCSQNSLGSGTAQVPGAEPPSRVSICHMDPSPCCQHLVPSNWISSAPLPWTGARPLDVPHSTPAASSAPTALAPTDPGSPRGRGNVPHDSPQGLIHGLGFFTCGTPHLLDLLPVGQADRHHIQVGRQCRGRVLQGGLSGGLEGGCAPVVGGSVRAGGSVGGRPRCPTPSSLSHTPTCFLSPLGSTRCE